MHVEFKVLNGVHADIFTTHWRDDQDNFLQVPLPLIVRPALYLVGVMHESWGRIAIRPRVQTALVEAILRQRTSKQAHGSVFQSGGASALSLRARLCHQGSYGSTRNNQILDRRLSSTVECTRLHLEVLDTQQHFKLHTSIEKTNVVRIYLAKTTTPTRTTPARKAGKQESKIFGVTARATSKHIPAPFLRDRAT